jgi:beta-hydroxyacyl-ACP dehydratase FabZ
MPKIVLGARQIMDLLPHRYPMLMVDRVLEITEDSIVAEKFVSLDEPFFQGHFPEMPIMPGVLILEALAQAAGLGVRYNEERVRSRGVVLAGVDKARFRKPVLPGSLLTLHAKQRKRRRDLFFFDGVARVEGDTVAEASFLAAFVDWEDQP